MKPTNSIYLGDRALDPPEELVVICCTYCHKSAYALQWVHNRGNCPRCHKPYAGPKNED